MYLKRNRRFIWSDIIFQAVVVICNLRDHRYNDLANKNYFIPND